MIWSAYHSRSFFGDNTQNANGGRSSATGCILVGLAPGVASPRNASGTSLSLCMSFCSAFIFYNSDVFVSSDKYVTRSEWDELARSHRILEERCYRVEALLLQFHPELAATGQPIPSGLPPYQRQPPQPALLPLPLSVPQEHIQPPQYRTPTTATQQPSASGLGPGASYGPSAILTPHSAPPLMSAPSPLRPQQPLLLSQPHGPSTRQASGRYSPESRKRLRDPELDYEAEQERDRDRLLERERRELPIIKEGRNRSPGPGYDYDYGEKGRGEFGHRDKAPTPKPLRLRSYNPHAPPLSSQPQTSHLLPPAPPRVEVSSHPHIAQGPASASAGSTGYHRGDISPEAVDHETIRSELSRSRSRGQRRASSTSPTALARMRHDELLRTEEAAVPVAPTSGLSGPGTGLGLVTPVSAKERERGREYATKRDREAGYGERDMEVKYESGTEGERLGPGRRTSEGERRRTCLPASFSSPAGPHSSLPYTPRPVSDMKIHPPTHPHSLHTNGVRAPDGSSISISIKPSRTSRIDVDVDMLSPAHDRSQPAVSC